MGKEISPYAVLYPPGYAYHYLPHVKPEDSLHHCHGHQQSGIPEEKGGIGKFLYAVYGLLQYPGDEQCQAVSEQYVYDTA